MVSVEDMLIVNCACKPQKMEMKFMSGPSPQSRLGTLRFTY
jgi:hypothetical protein